VARPARDEASRRERTLLVALLLSMWAPLATGIAVLLSSSTTQAADFVRRSVELVALATSWAVFRYVRRRPGLTAERAARLESNAARTVALALAVSGAVTLTLAAARLREFVPGGDVRLGLLVAVLGLVTNAVFWRRYAAMSREAAGAIIDAQRRLYRGKVAVDLCVIAALFTVLVAPDHGAARGVDIAGSVAVGIYLLASAWRTARAAGR
jgi:Co/Zn/Cd efflux system component